MKALRVSVLVITMFLGACGNHIITIPRYGGGITMEVTAHVSVLERTSILPSYDSTYTTDGIELESENYYLKLTNVEEEIVPTLLEHDTAVDTSTRCHTTPDHVECVFGPYQIQYRLSGED